MAAQAANMEISIIPGPVCDVLQWIEMDSPAPAWIASLLIHHFALLQAGWRINHCHCIFWIFREIALAPLQFRSLSFSFQVWWYSFYNFCVQSMTLNVAIYEWSSLTACYVRQSLNSNVHLFPVKHCSVGCSRNMTEVLLSWECSGWGIDTRALMAALLLLLWRDWSPCQDNELFTTSPTATAAQQQQRDWP